MLVTGIDLLEIERLRQAVERHGSRFLERVYTSRELDETGRLTASLAARFAAKEAVAKALGCGIGAVGWKEIEILRGPAGQPILHLHGAAANLAQEKGLNDWAISLSHSQNYATAVAVAQGSPVSSSLSYTPDGK